MDIVDTQSNDNYLLLLYWLIKLKRMVLSIVSSTRGQGDEENGGR